MNELVRDWKAEKKDLEEAFDIIADKLVKADAEIERLKQDHQIVRNFLDTADAKLLEKDKLITELVYWIESLWPSLSWGSDDSTMGRVRKLIQRAREATR